MLTVEQMFGEIWSERRFYEKCSAGKKQLAARLSYRKWRILLQVGMGETVVV